MAHVERDPETGEPQEVLTPREARQGPLGRPVLLVLAGSLALAVIAWLGLTLYGAMTVPPV